MNYKKFCIFFIFLFKKNYLLNDGLKSIVDLYNDNIEIKSFVDFKIKDMSLKEKIAQIFMIKILWNDNEELNKSIELIEKYNIGGVYIHSGINKIERVDCNSKYSYKNILIKDQIELINKLQSYSKIPLIIGQDIESGLKTRIEDGIKYPCALALSKIDDIDLIYELAEEISRQCKLVGVNFPAIPVVDINTNPNNPVIGKRSFSKNKETVYKLSKIFINVLQKNKIISCLKHFPGHGDTEYDSHLELPLINHSIERLKEIELYPFKKNIDENNPLSIMTAHVLIKNLDENNPVTLSKKIITDLLKNELNYKNIVITDALEMKAIYYDYNDENIINSNIRAFLAGNDILLYPLKVEKTIERLEELIKNDYELEIQLNDSLKKILTIKKWLGLFENKFLFKDNFLFVNNNYAKELLIRLYKSIIKLNNNENNLLPINKNLYDNIYELNFYNDNYKENDFIDIFKNYNLNNCKNFFILKIYSSKNILNKDLETQINELYKINKNLLLIFFSTDYLLKNINLNIPKIIIYENDTVNYELIMNILYKILYQ